MSARSYATCATRSRSLAAAGLDTPLGSKEGLLPARRAPLREVRQQTSHPRGIVEAAASISVVAVCGPWQVRDGLAAHSSTFHCEMDGLTVKPRSSADSVSVSEAAFWGALPRSCTAPHENSRRGERAAFAQGAPRRIPLGFTPHHNRGRLMLLIVTDA
jgi:hypothetical protein